MVVVGMHWTASPDRNTDQIGENFPKSVKNLSSRWLWTIFRMFFLDIFLTCLAKPLSPYSIQKRPEPQFAQNLSQRLFFGVPARGSNICKTLSKFKKPQFSDKFWQIFSKFWPPDWNPPKQSLGQILDKFGVRGVFECCKGTKVSQDMLSWFWFSGLSNDLPITTLWGRNWIILRQRGGVQKLMGHKFHGRLGCWFAYMSCKYFIVVPSFIVKRNMATKNPDDFVQS